VGIVSHHGADCHAGFAAAVTAGGVDPAGSSQPSPRQTPAEKRTLVDHAIQGARQEIVGQTGWVGG